MRPDELDYIQHRLRRAQETLDEAEYLLGGDFVAGVVNRLYYACFYAVSALLLSEGQSSAKHSGVMSLFDKNWIRPGRLPAEAGAFYHLMFEKRQKGDYEDLFSFDHADLVSWLEEAKVLVLQARVWLRDHAGLDLS